MKSTLKKALLLCLTSLLLLPCLASCKVNLQSGDNGLYDKKNNISYCHAAPVYEAISLLKEYGKLTVTDTESYTLYTIPGMDGTEMLATEDFNIVYADTLDMPTLMEMMPTILRVCNDSKEIKRMEDAETVLTLVGDYTEGEAIPYPGTTPLRTYKARFESVNYPGFYYTLTYVEYAENLVIEEVSYGKYFLYNAYDRRFVPVGDAIHKALGLE